MGANVEYYLLAVDELGNRLIRPEGEGEYYSFVTAYHCNDFEVDGEWTVGAPGDDATTGIWEWVDPIGTVLYSYRFQPESDATPDPGHLCWITGQYTGGHPMNSAANGITTLLSPIYDLTGMTWATVQYMRWFQTLSSSEGVMEFFVNYDGFRWELLDRVEGFVPEPEWETVFVVATPSTGVLGQTQFKLVMYGHPYPSMDEGGLDDFVLIADDQGGPVDVEPQLDTSETPVSLRLRVTNPAVGLATLEYALPSDGVASLTLYRVDGRKVRTLIRGKVSAGVHQVVWDGLDEGGYPAGSGVYFARFSTPYGTDVRRIVLAR
jgi:hypothetical protein